MLPSIVDLIPNVCFIKEALTLVVGIGYPNVVGLVLDLGDSLVAGCKIYVFSSPERC